MTYIQRLKKCTALICFILMVGFEYCNYSTDLHFQDNAPLNFSKLSNNIERAARNRKKYPVGSDQRPS